MHVSIKHVALLANVSRGTVSSVLNGRTNVRISPETKERVRQAANELGYIPNLMARSLFKNRTHLIGMLTSGIGNPFFAELIGACEVAIADAGYGRLVDASFPYVAKARPEIISVWPVDGILMHAAIGRISEGIIGTRVDHVPVVYLDSPADAYRDTVQFDLGPGLKAAAEHLIEATPNLELSVPTTNLTYSQSRGINRCTRHVRDWTIRSNTSGSRNTVKRMPFKSACRLLQCL